MEAIDLECHNSCAHCEMDRVKYLNPWETHLHKCYFEVQITVFACNMHRWRAERDLIWDTFTAVTFPGCLFSFPLWLAQFWSHSNRHRCRWRAERDLIWDTFTAVTFPGCLFSFPLWLEPSQMQVTGRARPNLGHLHGSDVSWLPFFLSWLACAILNFLPVKKMSLLSHGNPKWRSWWFALQDRLCLPHTSPLTWEWAPIVSCILRMDKRCTGPAKRVPCGFASPESSWVDDMWSWSSYETSSTWWFKVTFLGWLSDPFKGLSDLQLGDEKGTLNHLEGVFHVFPRHCAFSRMA